MRWLITILVTVICCGCSAPATGGTGGSTSSSGSGTSSTCPQTDSCDECTSCALAGPCEGLYNTCENDSDCMTIDECFEGCGGDSSCEQTCLANNPDGDTEYTNLLTCVNCDQCPTACGLCSN
jgi:hypothetical protein